MAPRPGSRDDTRDRIVAAVAEVLAEEHPATLSVPAVARRAGVSTRTVYRYFPTKADLVDAASWRHLEAVRPWEAADPADDLAGFLTPMWERFGADVAAVRAEHESAAGRSLRAARLPGAREQVRGSLRRSAPDLDGDDADRLTDLVVAVTSSGMFLELCDRLGHPPAQAAALAAWTVRAVTNQAVRDGQVPHDRTPTTRTPTPGAPVAGGTTTGARP